MMRKMATVALIGAVIVGMASSATAELRHRIGVGVHYWKTVDNIDVSDVDEDGLAWMISYQLRPASLLKFEADVEMLPNQFGGADETVYSPQAYVIVGSTIYAALGVGTYYADGEFANDPFYALRAGLDIALLPFLFLDINANYRFEEWNDIKTVDEDVSTDTITLGAVLRLQI